MKVHIEPFTSDAVHLDMLFSMLAPGLALIDKDRLPETLQRLLLRLDIQLIPADPNEAAFWGCNVVALGNDGILSSIHAIATNQRLRANGLDVLDPDLSVFAADGGSARCLTMPLARVSQP